MHYMGVAGRWCVLGVAGLQDKFSLGNSISLQQNQFLMGTQASTSPPDMASSGV